MTKKKPPKPEAPRQAIGGFAAVINRDSWLAAGLEIQKKLRKQGPWPSAKLPSFVKR